MPIVREYQADAAVGGPFDTRQARQADTGNVGGALSRIGSAVTDAGDLMHKRDVQTEISDVSAKMAAAHAGLTDNLDATLKAPGAGDDKDLSNKFMQNYDDHMGDIGNTVQTPEARQYFERANAQMRAHFTMASAQGQSAVMGEKAVTDYGTAKDNWSASLIKDPSSFETVSNLHSQMLDAQVQSGRLPEQKANELRAQGETDLAKSAVRGWIQLDPNFAKDQLSKGKWDEYFNGDQKFQMLKESEQGINAQRIEQERQQKAERDALSDAQNKTQDAFLAKMRDPQNPLTADEIIKSNLEPFGSGSKEQFLKMLDQSKNEKIKTDPDVYLGLAKRIGLPDGDPNKLTDQGAIYDAYTKGQLTHGALDELRTELSGSKTEEGQQQIALKKNFLKIAEDKLTKTNPMLGIKDPDGDEVFQSFQSAFYKQYNAGIKQGKTPQALLSPDSPDYLGKMLPSYARSPEDIMRSAYSNAPASSNAPSSTTTQSVPSPTPSTTQSGTERQGGYQKGSIATFQGKKYEFQGGENVQANWKEVK